jgi:uncharacterized protein involved in exopolysaccharide biosynthesis
MGFKLLHYLLLKRKAILWVTFGFLVAGILFAVLSRPTFETRALLIPPPDESSEGMLATWMAQLNLPSMVLPSAGGATTAALIRDILESRRLGEFIIESLDLKERYKTDTMDDALKNLRGASSVSVTSSGMITLRVRDEDPEFAVAIAERYIAGLDSMSRYLRFTRAENTIHFISGQLERYGRQLEQVRAEIAGFQSEYGIVDFEEQIKGAIDIAAAIKIQAVLARIELDLLREFARSNAIELRRKEAEYQNLSAQLARIVEGDTSEAVFIPLKDMPDLYQRYAALQRDLEVNEKVYSYLLQRLEESGIDRARNTPTVQVVDSPHVPARPAGLSRTAVALLFALVGFVWITALLSLWWWVTTRERPEDQERAFQDVMEICRLDLEKVRKLLRL